MLCLQLLSVFELAGVAPEGRAIVEQVGTPGGVTHHLVPWMRVSQFELVCILEVVELDVFVDVLRAQSPLRAVHPVYFFQDFSPS